MIVGFNLKKILVERKAPLRAAIKINTKTNITDIKKEDVEFVKEKTVLKFDFEFVVEYLSDSELVANINFEGELLYLVEPKEAKKILENWKKKEIEAELRVRIFNAILGKCNVKALILEEELGLPPHLPLPKFSVKEKEGKSK